MPRSNECWWTCFNATDADGCLRYLSGLQYVQKSSPNIRLHKMACYCLVFCTKQNNSNYVVTTSVRPSVCLSSSVRYYTVSDFHEIQYSTCLQNVNVVKLDSGRQFHLTMAHITFSTHISRPPSVAFDIRTVHRCQCHAFCSLSYEAISPHSAIYCKHFRVPVSSLFFKIDQ